MGWLIVYCCSVDQVQRVSPGHGSLPRSFTTSHSIRDFGLAPSRRRETLARQLQLPQLAFSSHLNTTTSTLTDRTAMSSSSQQRPSAPRAYHQDYIARIRYNNSLPPPLCPPKLLEVPNNAFAHYTDTAFASTLARAESLNIEVDSELGMPLDLTHIPRVFEGDDSVLRPLDPPPPVDPRDRALLRLAASLGKPNTATAAGGSTVSFLRRTEYISAEQSKSTFKSTTSERLVSMPKSMRRTARPEDNDPVRILGAVMRGFDVANPNDEASVWAQGDKAAANAERNWKELKHPNKPALKAVETFPLLPHLDGASDTGGYMVFKFTSAPVDPDEDGRRDERIDTALFQPVEIPGQEKEGFEFYLPDSEHTATAVKRRFSDRDEELDEDAEYRYNYVRRYETKSSRTYGPVDGQPEEVALALHTGDDDLQRGAYFYPILSRYTVRPKRKTKFQTGIRGGDDDVDLPAEALKLKLRELDESERSRRKEYVAMWEGSALQDGTQEETQEDGDKERGDDADAPGEDDEDAPGEDE
jgi:RNA polymerase II-associated factor 1